MRVLRKLNRRMHNPKNKPVVVGGSANVQPHIQSQIQAQIPPSPVSKPIKKMKIGIGRGPQIFNILNGGYRRLKQKSRPKNKPVVGGINN